MARSLQTKENVQTPDSDYIYGRIKDDSGSDDGTPVNESVYGDFHQFFARLLDKGGVTPNGFPDNEYSGFQYYEALLNQINSLIPPLNVKNTVFISKSGNDSTGLIERFDKPFLTYAAARAAAVAGFTGGNAPSATNKKMFRWMSGTYTEQVILLDYCDYDSGNAIIQVTSGDSTSSTIIDNNIACRCTWNGTGVIQRITTSTGLPASVFTQNGSTILNLNIDLYQNVDGNALNTGSAKVIHRGNTTMELGSGSSYQAVSLGSTSEIIGGKISHNNGYCLAMAGGAKITDCYVKCTKTNGDGIRVLSSDPILKNVTIVTDGTGKSISAASSTEVIIYGACEANVTTANITTAVGALTISSSVV